MAQNEQVRVDITADDNASRKLDDVAELVETLEKADVEIPVEADTRAASRALEDVEADARKLTDADRSVVIKAKMDDLRGELREIGDQADTTKRKLDDVQRPAGGANLRGQAIADLTGPLGDVSSTASDLAGVFDGIGDTFEAAAQRVGIDAGSMVTAIGGIGFGVAAASAAWGLFRQNQERAREEQRKLLEGQQKLNDLIEKGDFRAAGSQLVAMYGEVYDAADRAGVPIGDVTRYIAGLSDVVPGLTAKQRELADASDVGSQRWEDQAFALGDLTGKLDTARNSYAATNGTLADQASRADAAGDALQGNARSADDATRAQEKLEAAARRTETAFDALSGALDLEGEVLRVSSAIDRVGSSADTTAEDVNQLKQDIVQLAQDAGANPIEVKSTLAKIDRGDLAGVKSDVERWYANSPAVVSGTLKITSIQQLAQQAVGGLFTGGKVTGTSVGFPAAGFGATSVVNVTQYLPRGYRGDALAQADAAARRSGGMYRRRGRR